MMAMLRSFSITGYSRPSKGRALYGKAPVGPAPGPCFCESFAAIDYWTLLCKWRKLWSPFGTCHKPADVFGVNTRLAASRVTPVNEQEGKGREFAIQMPESTTAASAGVAF
jgi:hypothetical protein